MGTDTFRRHTRACVDAAIHAEFVRLRQRPRRAWFFERLLRAVQERSALMLTPPTPRGEVIQVTALRNLVPFWRALVREPEDWKGAGGHPLCVIDSLASHLFGRYPTPRFLASVWFGTGTPTRLERRRWFIAHARGQRFRSLALPFAMTRRMEHFFLRTPDHLSIDPALRRAEVLGLGGTPELADALLATPLAECFEQPERWRLAIAWLVRCGDDVQLAQIRPLVDYLQARLDQVELSGRSFSAVMREVDDWHGTLARERIRIMTWSRSPWNALTFSVQGTPSDRRRAEWKIVELLDSRELAQEGRAMRHCVATYARACASGYSSIWSLRHRWLDEDAARSVLTVEVRPATRMIVQLRGRANSRASGLPLELVRQWAAREGLRIDPRIAVADGAALPRAA
jgi:hypothetical protein